MVSIKVISEVIGELLGEEALNVFIYLKGKEKVSELKVAKDVKKDIHVTRSILYKLYENNLATFERKKDKQKGWYLTYWDTTPKNIPHLYKKLQQDKLNKLSERLQREQEHEFYMCKNACTRIDFEKAIAIEFKCPECGDLMHPVDNKRTIEFINEKIRDIKETLAQE